VQIEIRPYLGSNITAAEFSDLVHKVWPEAWFHNDTADQLWQTMADKNLDLRLVCTVDGQLAATFIATRVEWHQPQTSFDQLPNRGWEWVLEASIPAGASNSKIVSALSMNILPQYRGLHLSSKILIYAKEHLRSLGMETLIAPVRPFWKSRYPLIPMEDYVHWTNSKGEVFDPWLRVHVQIGAKVLHVCHDSMAISGTADQWLSWTGVEAIAPGSYLIPEGLVPVTFLRTPDGALHGKYVEPNVWVIHDL
jgi:hypothetical protein